jgi:hypothetical protein
MLGKRSPRATLSCIASRAGRQRSRPPRRQRVDRPGRLDATASPRVRLPLAPLEWPAFRQLDDQRYAAGLPNLFDADLSIDQIKNILSQPLVEADRREARSARQRRLT